MIEPLQWIFAADRLPDAELRVLLWLQAPDGAQDWDVGRMDADGWVLDWCGAAPAGQVLAWAEPAGPDATATPPGSGRDVLAQPKPMPDLREAKWLDPECADAGCCQSLKLKAAERERCALRLQGLMAPPSDTPWWGGWNAALKKAADLFEA